MKLFKNYVSKREYKRKLKQLNKCYRMALDVIELQRLELERLDLN